MYLQYILSCPALTVIALSSLGMEFNKVDFPTLGAPTIDTRIPSFKAFPYLKELTRSEINISTLLVW